MLFNSVFFNSVWFRFLLFYCSRLANLHICIPSWFCLLPFWFCFLHPFAPPKRSFVDSRCSAWKQKMEKYVHIFISTGTRRFPTNYICFISTIDQNCFKNHVHDRCNKIRTRTLGALPILAYYFSRESWVVTRDCKDPPVHQLVRPLVSGNTCFLVPLVEEKH